MPNSCVVGKFNNTSWTQVLHLHTDGAPASSWCTCTQLAHLHAANAPGVENQCLYSNTYHNVTNLTNAAGAPLRMCRTCVQVRQLSFLDSSKYDTCTLYTLVLNSMCASCAQVRHTCVQVCQLRLLDSSKYDVWCRFMSDTAGFKLEVRQLRLPDSSVYDIWYCVDIACLTPGALVVCWCASYSQVRHICVQVRHLRLLNSWDIVCYSVVIDFPPQVRMLRCRKSVTLTGGVSIF